jgi:hypothetical protein
MSRVTNAILVSPSWSGDFLDKVNVFFGLSRWGPVGFGYVSVQDDALPLPWYGGSKDLECEIAIGAFNHLDLEGLIEHLKSLSEFAMNPQSIVLEQDDSRFSIIDIQDTFGVDQASDE